MALNVITAKAKVSIMSLGEQSTEDPLACLSPFLRKAILGIGIHALYWLPEISKFVGPVEGGGARLRKETDNQRGIEGRNDTALVLGLVEGDEGSLPGGTTGIGKVLRVQRELGANQTFDHPAQELVISPLEDKQGEVSNGSLNEWHQEPGHLFVGELANMLAQNFDARWMSKVNKIIRMENGGVCSSATSAKCASKCDG